MADYHSALTLAGPHRTGSIDKPASAGAGRYIVGNWSHIFASDGPPSDVRIVFDTASKRLVAMQIHTHRGYLDAGRAQLEEVQDSLLTANAHVLESPVAEAFQLAAEMPDWSTPECCNGAFLQFEREIAFAKLQYGILIGQLALELEAGGGDAIEEFRWDVVDAAKGNLASAAANESTDDSDDQSAAIANTEVWVAEHVSNGTLLDLLAASIVLSSASETETAVFQVLTSPTAAPGGA